MRLVFHQRCLRAVLGMDELEIVVSHLSLEELVARRRRAAGPRPRRLNRRERAQLYLFPPLLRPRSYFARKPLNAAERAFGLEIIDEAVTSPPEGCTGRPGPCPFVSCRHHLAIEVNEIGSLKVLFPGWEITDLEETCSLQVAKEGPQTVERVARLLNISAERVRQIERGYERKLRHGLDPDGLLRR
jgi:hypothetical protein